MKHANGYSDYRKLDQLPRHRVQHDGYDTEGIPLCICTYPIVGCPKREEAERSHLSTPVVKVAEAVETHGRNYMMALADAKERG